MIFSILAYFPPIIIAYAVLSHFPTSETHRPFLPLIAMGLGIGIVSSLFFLWSVLFGISNTGFILMELSATIFILLRLWLSGLGNKNDKRANTQVYFPAILVFFLAAIVFITYVLNETYGDWDAWAIWNFKARYIYRVGDNWLDHFIFVTSRSHPDYPLLTPCFIASRWLYFPGGDTPTAPIILAALFTFSTMYLLYLAIEKYKGKYLATIAVAIVISAGYYLYFGASQFADVPLSFYLLLFFVLITVSEEEKSSSRTAGFILAGIALGLGTFTKNEGLLHAAVCLAVLFWRLFSRSEKYCGLKDFSSVILGAIPFILTSIGFKIGITAQTDIFVNQSVVSQLERLSDLSRIMLVSKTMFVGLITYSPIYIMEYPFGSILVMPILFIIFGFQVPENMGAPLKYVAYSISLIAFGYSFVYLITPQDVTWHLSTSLLRLITHLWPSIVFLGFMCIGKEYCRISKAN